MTSRRQWAALVSLVAAGGLLGALCWAQAGGQQGGPGAGSGRGLVPRGIDLILANPADNSLIVRDPPVEDPNAPPKLVVRAQWLEVVRVGPQLLVRSFRTVESPDVVLTSGQTGEVKVKTPTQAVTYPLRVVLGKDGVLSMSLYAPDRPGEVTYRLKPEEGVRLGQSVVAKGLIFPQADGGQRETYLQFAFAPEPAAASAKGTVGGQGDGGK